MRVGELFCKRCEKVITEEFSLRRYKSANDDHEVAIKGGEQCLRHSRRNSQGFTEAQTRSSAARSIVDPHKEVKEQRDAQ